MQVVPLSVYYGSGSGNAQRLAESFAEELTERGHEIKLANLKDVEPVHLHEDRFVLFIVSTWGEGEPPPDAQPFCQAFTKDHNLTGLHYAVVALGDACFRKFCGCGVDLDANLTRCGALPFLPLEKLDVCFHPGFEAWKDRFYEKLSKADPEHVFGRDGTLQYRIAA